MTVTVKTFTSLSEAAAALSSDRNARYLGGGTLVMRALNEGDISISTVVRANDHALMRIDPSGPRITLGAGVTFARILGERDLAFLHAPARSIGGPAVRNMGTVGGNLFAPNPYGDFTVAMLALDATVALQGGFGSRDIPIEEFLQSRERQAGTLVLSVSCTRPGERGGFPLPQDRTNQAQRRLGYHARRTSAYQRRAGRRGTHCIGIDGADANTCAGGRTRAGRPLARCRDHCGRSLCSRGRNIAVRQRARQRLVSPRDRRRTSASSSLGSGIDRMARTALQFRHNGSDVAIFVDGGTNLLVALRELIGDMTPKFGCGQGGCGTCSVLVDGELHLSCLTLAETVAGRSVETLDSLKQGPNLHPLQRAFAENFAAQCGYCTPGMLMAAKALLDRNPSPSRAEIVEAISGNICRCTGYEPIINAILAASGGRVSA
ncbi:aerobic-type carbon monoxide dehydrogenase small subunit (CoxS/CutS family) [Bradyrhizobium sp. F1.13.4]